MWSSTHSNFRWRDLIKINNKTGNLTQEQINVAMQGAPRVDDAKRQMEVTIVESPEFKVNF